MEIPDSPSLTKICKNATHATQYGGTRKPTPGYNLADVRYLRRESAKFTNGVRRPFCHSWATLNVFLMAAERPSRAS